MQQTHSLGIDVGSVNAKLVLCDADGSVLRADTEKITASPHAAVAALLERLAAQIPLDTIGSAGVSGAGQAIIPTDLGWATYSSSLALAAGILQAQPAARTLIQVGGQSSLVVRLADGLRRPWQVATNPLCAAGTGRFLEQQAYRLGIELDDFSGLALGCQGRPPRIAARCSVFAKSDLIHLQQKGVPVSAMLYALCESIARMVTSLSRGEFAEPVLLAGGLAANGAFVKALGEALSARNGRPTPLTVAKDYLHVEALGAALLARGKPARVARLPDEESGKSYRPMAALVREGPAGTAASPAGQPQPAGDEATASAGYLGLDIGSTSTKAVVLDESGTRVLAKHYLMTAGRPIEAVKELFRGLLAAGAGEIAIRGAGVTGSGRYLVGSFIGADLVKNEITAQTRAAVELDPDADIIEIGGQDSKLVLKRHGVVVDYQMNKACAAGTGSFIDELAEMLGVSVKNGEFARLAFEAPYTIDLGTRCAAFMAQAVATAQQEGYPLPVICASLAVSIARNYLSKVVANRKLGSKIILTGAVFYNEAVASAFRSELAGKTLTVPEHKEVSGAIGAALLAREALLARGAAPEHETLPPHRAVGASGFRGFATVVASEPRLTTFTCSACANNCAITRMQIEGSPATYYGSRCDRYDALPSDRDGEAVTAHEAPMLAVTAHEIAPAQPAPARHGSRRETYFDERERLLFAGYETPARPETPPRSAERGAVTGAIAPGVRSGPLVAIPRALLMYDYAPLVLGFLNELGARALLSGGTDKRIMEQSVELSYTDSCFPLKLLHGHADSVAAAAVGADFLLYPSLQRLGPKDGDENQRYACPLVQAAPFIVRAALDLGARLLAPTIDLSRGPEPALRSLAGVAQEMGYGEAAGRRAAQAGLAAQERFAAGVRALGARRLAELRAGERLGVVLFARSYMSQDAGANLGIADKLAQLGVTPVPLDFLPIETVDPKRYSDRPYWYYESKQIAAAALTAEDSRLYGLVLTNFGCGPNSFILRLVEDIMGSKPLGQLEIDEHAAEAGIVTRLEAFVDTIVGHARNLALQPSSRNGKGERSGPPSGIAEGGVAALEERSGVSLIYRGTTAVVGAGKTLLLPRMAPHADVLCAAFEACGARARVLPEADERNLLYANQVTSGVECLPYRVSLGDFIRAHHEMNGELKDAEGFMAGSYGPCRLGKYAIEQMRALREMGISLTIRSTVSNSAYRDLNLGSGFERLSWQGIVAMDSLQKLLWRSRPYEREVGGADDLFDEFTRRIATRVRRKEPFDGELRQAAGAFRALIDPALPRRPRVGINGEIYLRANSFSNSDLVRVCERAGLEVVVSPLGEWFKYTAFRNVEDARHDRKYVKMAMSYVKQMVQERDERVIGALAGKLAGGREPSTAELLRRSSLWLSPTCGSEAVLSLGSGLEWLESADFAGVISVMPHGCMPGGIVAAMSEKLSALHGKPWINLTYDGFMETNNLARISNFAEVIRFASRST